MKAIHYDADGDILSVTFGEAGNQKQTGVELSDNLVLYYNPETEQPLQLIMISYQAMLEASAKTPIALSGLAALPTTVQATVVTLLNRTPLTGFLKLVKMPNGGGLASQLQAVFTPDALQMVAAA